MTQDDDESVACGEHGGGRATYVCVHLAADPVQRWYGEYPDDDAPWPDAWCAACNEHYASEGEWNERNEDAIQVTALCHHCYEAARGRSVQRLAGPARSAWDAYVAASCALMARLQDEFRDAFAIDRHERWDWSQGTAQLVFSNHGTPAVVADIVFVGSVSSVSDTWLWSWANPHLETRVRERMTEVRDYGETRDFPHLTTAKWPADEHDGWHMTAIAARVLGARGVYRTPDDTGHTFMVVTDARWVTPPG